MTLNPSVPPSNPRRTPSPGPSGQFQGEPARSPPRILIVDDNEQNIELLEAYLEELDANITTATDGVEALRLIAMQAPDVILLDVMMPRMSGFQLCTRLKGAPATKGIKVILVTALNEVSDVERGHECGADDFLTKPVNKLELLARIRVQLASP